MVLRKDVKEFARCTLGGKMGKGGIRRNNVAWKELWRKKEGCVEALSEDGQMTWGEVRLTSTFCHLLYYSNVSPCFARCYYSCLD